MDSGCSILFFEEPIANDIAARVKWGTSQHIVIYEFDPNSGGENILVDHKALSLAFSERKNRKKLFLYVDIESKVADLASNSIVTQVMSNAIINNVSAPIQSSNEAGVVDVIDWDSPDTSNCRRSGRCSCICDG